MEDDSINVNFDLDRELEEILNSDFEGFESQLSEIRKELEVKDYVENTELPQSSTAIVVPVPTTNILAFNSNNKHTNAVLVKEIPLVLSKAAESCKAILNSLQGAAFQSRLPYSRISSAEEKRFPDLVDKASVQHFLHIRNRLLHMWLQNPKEELLLQQALSKLEPPFNSNSKLIARIHSFLERYGYINFGRFNRLRALPRKKFGRVIIVGAGIAGLIAAQHLQHFGLEVVVVEARDRVGGRMATFRRESNVADLGAMLLHGIHGNPLSVLAQQNAMELTPITWNLNLYSTEGNLIDKDYDMRMKKEFDELLMGTKEVLNHLEEYYNATGNSKAQVSLGEAIDYIMYDKEKNRKIRYIAHLKNITKKQKELESKQTEIDKLCQELLKLQHIQNQLFELRVSRRRGGSYMKQPEMELEKREVKLQWSKLKAAHTKLLLEAQELEREIEDLENRIPSANYLSTADRKLINWHIADLEAMLGTELDEIPLKYFHSIQESQFIGSQTIVRNGMSFLPISLTQGLDVRLNTAARYISYNAKGVEVMCENTRMVNHRSVLQADLVLCTLPLGVLKASLSVDPDSILNYIRFEPALPVWKRKAIIRMGVGLVNKVVLCFEQVFWDPNVNAFGNVNTDSFTRGELYLFCCISKCPVLVATISGETAWCVEQFSDKEVVMRCVHVLKEIFGENIVPFPKETLITRWGMDPCSRGSTSYTSLETLSTDYDALADPVIVTTNLNANDACNKIEEIPRLFFAGEHTIRDYAGTVHGAFISGLREAGRIIDFFMGIPNENDTIEEEEADKENIETSVKKTAKKSTTVSAVNKKIKKKANPTEI